MSDPKLLDAYYVDGLVAATGSLSSDISTLQAATGILRADIDSNDTDISALQTATGTLRADIDSNDTEISALQTATGVLSQVSVTGSSPIHAPDLTGVGNVTVTLDGSIVKISGAGGDVTFNAQTGTSYTLALSDNGKIISMSNASANTLTIPLNSSVDFPTGAQITIIQKGAGQTTITGDVGVTINSIDSNKKIASQYGAVTCVQELDDTWYMFGNLTS